MMRKITKQIVLWIVFLFAVFSFGSSKSFAANNFIDLSWWVDWFAGDGTFGYTSSDQITVSSIDDTSVELKSPVVKDWAWYPTLSYAVLFGKYPIEQAMDDPSLLDEFGEKEINLSDNPGSTFTISLNTTDDDLDPSATYYAVILPKDELGLPGEISNDICFILDSHVYGNGTECDNSSSAGHAAGGADMNLANITHAINGDTITLRWTALEWADKIELFLRDPKDERFNLLDTVNMDSEEYSFKTNRNGEHNIKFVPTNGDQPAGTETIYTLTVTSVPQGVQPQADTTTTTTTTVGITKVPVVGPKENIIVVLLVSLLAYLLYRFFLRRKVRN